MSDLQQEAKHNWRQAEQAWQGVQRTWCDRTTEYFEAKIWLPMEREVCEYNDEFEALLLDLEAATRAARAYAVVPRPQRRR